MLICCNLVSLSSGVLNANLSHWLMLIRCNLVSLSSGVSTANLSVASAANLLCWLVLISCNYIFFSLGVRTTAERCSSTSFAALVTEQEVAALPAGVTPASTDKTTKWAVSNFEAWKEIKPRNIRIAKFLMVSLCVQIQPVSVSVSIFLGLYLKQESQTVNTTHLKHCT